MDFDIIKSVLGKQVPRYIDLAEDCYRELRVIENLLGTCPFDPTASENVDCIYIEIDKEHAPHIRVCCLTATKLVIIELRQTDTDPVLIPQFASIRLASIVSVQASAKKYGKGLASLVCSDGRTYKIGLEEYEQGSPRSAAWLDLVNRLWEKMA